MRHGAAFSHGSKSPQMTKLLAGKLHFTRVNPCRLTHTKINGAAILQYEPSTIAYLFFAGLALTGSSEGCH
jgi:hypothetical protein